ncbi:MAG TPA: response regulator [Gemmatimonadales bacterium]|nr:response regulator [Gemmatimonadales bacterium]
MTSPAQAYSRPIRAVAAVVFVAVALRQYLSLSVAPPAAGHLLMVRMGALAAALLVAALASPTRSIRTLRSLALALILTLVLAGCGSGLILPSRVWEIAGLLPALVLGTALFIPWPWQWQAALAGLALVAEVATFSLIPENALPVPFMSEGALALLFMSGLGSVIGARIAGDERRRIAESEARFRALFVGAGDPIAALDPDGRVRDANPRLLTLLGRSLDDVRGKFLAHLLAPGRGDGWLLAPLEAATTGAVSHVEQVRRADGAVIELEVTLARVETPAGPLVQAILHDRTERRALERRQVQNERLDGLARFAGGIAHQFNNLLGGILTHASLLRTEATDAGVPAVDEILGAARRGRDLTKELLRFTKSGELSLRPTRTQEVLDRVSLLARAALPAQMQIAVEADPGLPSMLADPDQLSHAIYQLVLNARDAMRDQASGKVTIAAGRETVERDPRWPDASPGAYVRISVTDTGVGMDATTVERVLEPFFSTKPMHQAPGLGLAAVYGVVRDHGGSVRIGSALGRGTTVDLLIPRTAEAEPAPKPSEPAPPPAPATGMVILVVDDEAIVRSSLKRALTRYGHRVLEAQDGPSALTALQSARPPVDLVILDLVLPGGGAGILELLKATQPGLKVLVSSGYSPDHDVVKGIENRADGFLQKPFEIGDLRKAVGKFQKS